MPITLRRAIVKIGGSYRLTIPPEVMKMLGLKEGDEVEFDTLDKEVVIRKARRK